MSNQDLIERNELNGNSRGGTELMMERLYDGKVSRELLEKFQIIPSRVRVLDDVKKKILWLHDLPEDPESSRLSDPSFRAKLSKIVCVSNWQLQRYNATRGVQYHEATVIQNSIEPLALSKARDDDQVRLVYHTTPHRGLNILIAAFEEVAKKHPYAILDVFSSFSIYGWGERDEPFKEMFDRCRNHPQINYHGAVDNVAVRTHLESADIFAYPCTWQETSCLSLIEAMSAGLLCIHPNFSALPETAMGLTWMYDWCEDINGHAGAFAAVLDHGITTMKNKRESMQHDLMWQKAQADRVYDWNKNFRKWEALLTNLSQ